MEYHVRFPDLSEVVLSSHSAASSEDKSQTNVLLNDSKQSGPHAIRDFCTNFPMKFYAPEVDIFDAVLAVCFLVDIFISAIFLTAWILLEHQTEYRSITCISVAYGLVLLAELITVILEISRQWRDTANWVSATRVLVVFSVLKFAQDIILVIGYSAKSYCGYTKPLLVLPVAQVKNWFSFIAFILWTLKCLRWISGNLRREKWCDLKLERSYCIIIGLCTAMAFCFSARVFYFHLTYGVKVHCYTK